MDIINLNPSHKKAVVKVLSAAFFDYPEFKAYFPDPSQRERRLPWYLGRVLDTALNYGDVYTTQAVSGVALILRPGHTRISQWEYIRSGFLPAPFVLGPREFSRSQAGEEYIGDLHEKIMFGRPHYYLWCLAVDPAQKQTGIGSALLKPVLAKADTEKKPFYLETHDEKNVLYYQRYGFHLAKTACIPEFDIPVWCMQREPA